MELSFEFIYWACVLFVICIVTFALWTAGDDSLVRIIEIFEPEKRA